MSDEAARAAHAAVGEIATQRRLDPVLCQQWDVCASCRELSHGVAAAVLAADPSYAALVIVFGAVVAFLDAQREADRTGTWRQVSAASVRLRDAANELARDHPHLLDAARGQEGQHGA